MKLTCLHVPDIPCHLLLPLQQIAQQGTSKLPEGAWLGKQMSAKVFYDGHVIDFPYNIQLFLKPAMSQTVSRMHQILHLHHRSNWIPQNK
jgi:hypothetical protein